LTGLAGLFAGLHVQLAMLTECPGIAMTEADAKAYLNAWQNVLRHYSLEATQKAIDIFTLSSLTLVIYTPRLALGIKRYREGAPRQREAEYRSGPARIFQFGPSPVTAASVTPNTHAAPAAPPAPDAAD
jgi:hypothetical protein